MASRWKHDRPMSRTEFEARFPDDDACARHLAERRWLGGFVCPVCGVTKGWALRSKPHTWECSGCGRQTSVTAGTIMHRSHLPLRVWFLAAHIVTSHSNGISALQLQAQLGLGSYKSAWLMLHKLRRAMVDPDRGVLRDFVEVDETEMPYRTKADPVAGGQGRSHVGKLLMIGAVELSDEGRPRRIRLEPIGDFSGQTVRGFVERVVEPGAVVTTDGWRGYNGLAHHEHDVKVVGKMAAHVLLPWIHRVFSNLKRWAMGVLHGLRRKHLHRYLNEFVFRWNRRRHMRAAFETILGVALKRGPATYSDFVAQRA
jgi:predicted RNA-binding Zn-ribbon protein involved in translation (DUF1610 family)